MAVFGWRSQVLSAHVANSIGAVLIGAVVAFAAATAHAAGVVGTGNAASCTDAALNAALEGGGLVTFNCGGSATIDISTGTGTKIIDADTVVDGGGLITISGGNQVTVFGVSGADVAVRGLTIANGFGRGRRSSGGIAHDGPASGSMTVANCTFVGNQGTFGGAIGNFSGSLTVINSTFTGNRADLIGTSSDGAGIASTEPGPLLVVDSPVTDNRPGVAIGPFPIAHGAAIANFSGSLTVIDSAFTDNIALISGGGIVSTGHLTVTNSTFSGNRAGFGGGGIATLAGTLTVANSTFASNDGGSVGGGISISGDSSMTVLNGTFTGNSAAEGGGIDVRVGPAALLRNTILAASSSGGNCSGSLTDGGHNLDDGTSCGFSTTNGSLNDSDPQLDPAGLQSNGGPTHTVALCTGSGVPAGCTAASPAIDAGDQAVCETDPVNGIDQRGFGRPGTGRTACSIGAYEVDATPPDATPTETATFVPTATPTPTETPTFAPTGSPTETTQPTFTPTLSPTETLTPTFAATPTQARPMGVCTGDCAGSGLVAINDLITLVSIALDNAQPAACPKGIPSGADVDVTVLILAVNNALSGCPG